MRRSTIAITALILLAAGCSSDGTESVQAGGEVSTATPTPAELQSEGPLTSTVGDVDDTEADAAPAASATPDGPVLVPDGGALVNCADVPDLQATIEADLGSLTNVPDDVVDLVVEYRNDHPATYGTMFQDNAAGGVLVLAFTDDPDVHRERLATLAPGLFERDDVAIDIIQVESSAAELSEIQDGIGELARMELGITGIGSGGLKNLVEIWVVDPPEGALATIEAAVPTAFVCVDVTITPEPPAGPLRVIPDLATDDPLVTCDAVPPMPLSRLLAAPSIDDVDHPAVDALRTELAGELGERRISGDWLVMSIDDDTAAFRADDGYAWFEHQRDRWFLTGFGGAGPCQPQLALPEPLARVQIFFERGVLPDPSSDRFDVMVSEGGCSGGRDMGDALLGPEVIETDDSVLLAFAVIPVTGPAPCPGNPATRVTIELEQPLGDRVVLDGLYVPARPLRESDP